MQPKKFASALGFAALFVGFSCALPVSAQFTRFPEPPTLLTAKDVSTKSPVLSLYSFSAIEAEKGSLQFEDRGGSLVLSQALDESLVVTPGTILDNSNTKILWSSTLGTKPLKFMFAVGEGEERLLDNTGKIIWLQVTSEQAGAGIAATRYNAGLVVPFTITKESGTVDIADRNYRLLKTVPSESLRLTVLTADEKFPKYAPSPFSARNRFELLPDVARTQPDPLAPGRLYVTYHNADGTWVDGERMRVNKAKRQTGILRMSTVSVYQETLEVNIRNLNKAGQPESRPSLKYGWSKPF